MANIFLANVVWYAHLLVVLVFTLGPLLPGWLLNYTIWGYPLTMVAWYLNNNRCVLTDLENHYRGNKATEQFIKSLLMNVGLTSKMLDHVAYLLVVPWALCYIMKTL